MELMRAILCLCVLEEACNVWPQCHPVDDVRSFSFSAAGVKTSVLHHVLSELCTIILNEWMLEIFN